jgi:hypothetical protein
VPLFAGFKVWNLPPNVVKRCSIFNLVQSSRSVGSLPEQVREWTITSIEVDLSPCGFPAHVPLVMGRFFSFTSPLSGGFAHSSQDLRICKFTISNFMRLFTSDFFNLKHLLRCARATVLSAYLMHAISLLQLGVSFALKLNCCIWSTYTMILVPQGLFAKNI